MVWVFFWGGLGLIVSGIGFVLAFFWRENDSAAVFFFVACVAIAVVTGVTAGGMTIDRIVCRNKAANLELPYKWSPSAGCLVKVNGRWFDIDHVQSIGGEVSVDE